MKAQHTNLCESREVVTTDGAAIKALQPVQRRPGTPSKLGHLKSKIWSLLNRSRALFMRLHPFYRWRTVQLRAERELFAGDSDASSAGEQAWILKPPAGQAYPWGPISVSMQLSGGSYPLTARLQYRFGADLTEGLAVWLVLASHTLTNKLVHLPQQTSWLRLVVCDSDKSLKIDSCRMRELGLVHRILSKVYDAVRYVIENPRAVRIKLGKAIAMFRRGGIKAIRERLWPNDAYAEWVLAYDTLSEGDREGIRSSIEGFSYKPLISIVLPVYNLPEQFLRAAIESVRRQLYPNWELCIADDNSPDPRVREVIQEYGDRDPRIKYILRTTNGHIAAATNSAASLAQGDFIGFLDHDDELREHALSTMVQEINLHRDAELLYSDEDKITGEGVRHYPHFKSDWNPELLLCQNYVCHFTVVKRSLFEKVGGIQTGFDGAQDWDFVLRASERITPDKIRHVPKILYHWRVIDGSTAKSTDSKPYVTAAQVKAVQEHLERIGDRGAYVQPLPLISMLRVRYATPDPQPLVSLIVPTYNQRSLLSVCVDGILNRTSYKNIELLIIDNRSDDPDTLRYLESLRQDSRVTVIRDDGPFNFARINNNAVQQSRGSLVAFVNNDIQVMRPDWLHEMVSNVVRTDVGAVGARLLYPNGTVQHAGVVLGIGGVADHMMKHARSQSIGYFCRAIVAQNISAVTAACMLVKRDVFQEIGGFDEENFSVAYNDIDFCLRLRDRGYLIVYTPYAELAHHESVSRGYEDTPEKLERFQREFNTMRERWGHLLERDPYYNPNLSLARHDFGLAWPPR